MLPAAHRLRRSEDFRLAVRRGRRSGTPLLVAHLVLTPNPTAAALPAQVGFVVSKAVGGAVVRNQVKRRLRALLAARLVRLPAGARLVLRALPGSGDASSPALGADVDRLLARLLPTASPA